MDCAGLRCCVAFPAAEGAGYSLLWSQGPGARQPLELGLPGSRVQTQWLWPMGSAVAHGLLYTVAGGIFPAQGSNPCLPHRQANSL